jgi:hypothetical protein
MNIVDERDAICTEFQPRRNNGINPRFEIGEFLGGPWGSEIVGRRQLRKGWRPLRNGVYLNLFTRVSHTLKEFGTPEVSSNGQTAPAQQFRGVDFTLFNWRKDGA